MEKYLCTLYKSNQQIYNDTIENKSKKENEFYFSLLDYETTIDLEKQTFLRENEEFCFFLDIQNKKCQVYLKKEDLTVDVLVEECQFIHEKDKIVLEYFIESDTERIKLVLEKRMKNE